jgi:RimJ/RimL family protein N-acetyltransferase
VTYQPEPIDIDGVLYGATFMVAQFVAERIPHLPGGQFRGGVSALGVVVGEKPNMRLVGGVVFTDYRGHDIDVSLAFDDPRWVRKALLKRLFAYPFLDLGVARITALTADDDKMQKFMRWIGWRQEGRHVQALDGTHDMLSWRMLRSECRWLEGN